MSSAYSKAGILWPLHSIPIPTPLSFSTRELMYYCTDDEMSAWTLVIAWAMYRVVWRGDCVKLASKCNWNNAISSKRGSCAMKTVWLYSESWAVSQQGVPMVGTPINQIWRPINQGLIKAQNNQNCISKKWNVCVCVWVCVCGCVHHNTWLLSILTDNT